MNRGRRAAPFALLLLLAAWPARANALTWSATQGQVRITDTEIQFSYMAGTVEATLETAPDTTATFQITVNNTETNTIGWEGATADSWSVELIGAETATATGTEIGTFQIELAVLSAGQITIRLHGIDNGFWAGYYGPTMTGWSLTTTAPEAPEAPPEEPSTTTAAPEEQTTTTAPEAPEAEVAPPSTALAPPSTQLAPPSTALAPPLTALAPPSTEVAPTSTTTTTLAPPSTEVAPPSTASSTTTAPEAPEAPPEEQTTTTAPSTTIAPSTTTTTTKPTEATEPTNTQPAADAPNDIKKAFENQTNIFDGNHDNYTPTGSTITVAERRTVIAATIAATTIIPTTPRRRR